MNKICTDINQSQKLMGLGIDIDTADMFYADLLIDDNHKYNLHLLESYGFKTFGETYLKISNHLKFIPAWSLTVLFKMLPYSARLERGSSTELYCVALPDELKSSDWYTEPIDAAFEMVCWLKENGKL